MTTPALPWRLCQLGLVVLWWLGAAPLRAQELEFQLQPPAAGLRFAAEVPFVAFVRWPGGVPPDTPLPVDAFLPLQVDITAVAVLADGRTAHRGRARCLAAGDVTVGPVVVRVGEAVLRSAPVRLQVASCLPEPAGELEWDVDVQPLRPPANRLLGWLAAAALVLAFGIPWWRRQRRPRPIPVGPHPEPAPARDLLAELWSLPVPAAADAAAVVAFHAAMKALLRAHLAVSRRLASECRTSEELRDALPQLPLRPVFAAIDGVLFGARRPTAAECAQCRELAAAVWHALPPEPAGEPS
jgi:hypothetical protein